MCLRGDGVYVCLLCYLLFLKNHNTSNGAETAQRPALRVITPLREFSLEHFSLVHKQDEQLITACVIL